VEGLRGIVGVDFVRDEATGEVTVIEINPRPTTTYVGLMGLLPPGSLAHAWLDLFSERGSSDDLHGMIVPGDGAEVEFLPDGTILQGARRE
jgi:hypothetical protein